ncbi:zinc finger, CCHC-type containing protein [Tanacetum coccineum]
MLTKITKKPFQNVKHETKVLELIHNDLCDLHATPSMRNKKYFVTFIDEASRAESRVMGTVVGLPNPKLKTLGERGIECIFVGYAEHSKAFRFYVFEPNESVAINSIIESIDAIFDENRFSSVPRPSLRILNGTKDIGGSVVHEKVTEEVIQRPEPELRKSKRNRTPKNVGLYFNYISLKEQGMSTIRLLIAMASIHNLIIHQMYVKTTFLNGELEEEVYMNQPQGFIMPGNENKVDLTKEFLSSRFSMKDMGEADVILVSTLMDTSEKLMPNNGQAVSQLEYSRVIGCLMYAMTCTRPDIAFVVRQPFAKVVGYSVGGGVNFFGIPGKKMYLWIQPKESKFVALAATGKKAEWLKNLRLACRFMLGQL